MKILHLLSALLFSMTLLLAASPAADAGEKVVTMKGTAPAYQINRHDAHNRFCYDGSCILKGAGEIAINLRPDTKSGRIEATFDGPDGKWRIVQTRFKLIATDVNLHGATGGDVDAKLSPPVLPQVWTYVATWGPATVYHNGKLVWKGPAHLMVTEEVRDPVTGKVDYKGPKMAREYPGSIYNKGGVQVHYVTHPDEAPTKGYLPPFTKFVHLMWDTVVWE
ncbi:MAG: hypothetical protein ACE5EI_08090 [Thermodesulfobacteriota bacterium]